MHDDTIHTETTEHGYRLSILPDYDPLDPRDADQLGYMVCFHPHYDLGDEHEVDFRSLIDEGVEQGKDPAVAMFEAIERDYHPTVVLPLYLLDHSGLSIATGQSPFDPGGWDTSFVGHIFDTEVTRERIGIDNPTPEVVEEYLRAEVEEYDRYLRGEFCGFVVEDPSGEVVDSCFGFSTFEDALSEAASAADHTARQVLEGWSRLLSEYTGRLVDVESVTAQEARRYVLVERSTRPGMDAYPYFLSTHHSKERAASYHDDQEYPEDWSIRMLVDLLTGKSYYAKPQTTFHAYDTKNVRVGV